MVHRRQVVAVALVGVGVPREQQRNDVRVVGRGRNVQQRTSDAEPLRLVVWIDCAHQHVVDDLIVPIRTGAACAIAKVSHGGGQRELLRTPRKHEITRIEKRDFY